MNWIFCNNCTLKFDPKVKYHLSECGHIFCIRCLQLSGQSNEPRKCRLCKKTVATMEISQKMDPQAQMFFWPMENIIELNLKVLNFQTMQRSIYLDNLTRKHNHLKKDCIQLHLTVKNLQNENKTLKAFVRSNGGHVTPIVTSTPIKSPYDVSRQSDNNISFLSSIRPSPGNLPGSAQRIMKRYAQLGPSISPANFSIKDPSPNQRVPGNAYPAHGYPKVHRNPVMRSQGSGAMPNLMYKCSSSFQNSPSVPRK